MACFKGAFTIFVDKPDAGKRLDVAISSNISGCSRSLAASLARNGKIRVKGTEKKPGYRVSAGDEIRGHIPPPEPVLFKPEPIKLDILFEDNHLIVINKEAGLVVHPAPGHYTGTLVNGLLYHCPDLTGVGGEIRPGIVHRLDKDTSGAIVVAKNDTVHNNLSLQFKSKKIKKKYLALVYGKMESDSGTISLPIGRHPIDRKKMSTISRKGRSAETSWRVKERFQGVTFLELSLKTGRTHQIRVHCATINHPIVGDSVYCSRKAVKSLIKSIPRQMLHAYCLGFTHPITQKFMSLEAPIPQDMSKVLNELRKEKCLK